MPVYFKKVNTYYMEQRFTKGIEFASYYITKIYFNIFRTVDFLHFRCAMNLCVMAVKHAQHRMIVFNFRLWGAG